MFVLFVFRYIFLNFLFRCRFRYNFLLFSYFLHFVLNHVFFTITLYLLAEYCTGNDMWKNCDGKKQTQKLLWSFLAGMVFFCCDFFLHFRLLAETIFGIFFPTYYFGTFFLLVFGGCAWSTHPIIICFDSNNLPISS